MACKLATTGTALRQETFRNQTVMPTQRLFANDSHLTSMPLHCSAAGRLDALLSEIQACRVCEAHLRWVLDPL